MISAEAWVLRREQPGESPVGLVREEFEFADISEEEVLVRPIWGCWEGNMDHAIQRSPIDVCSARNEERIVIGNAGVVQVVRTGRFVRQLEEGDLCIVFCNGDPDANGYPRTIVGYDAPGTMGVLAKTTKFHHRQLIRIPPASPHSLQRWAAFSLRYITAWANWLVARTCWRSQVREEDLPASDAFVYAWGGGVSLAELTLAHAMGYRATMVSSRPARLERIRGLGIDTLDRVALEQGDFEQGFLEAVRSRTGGRGVSIFVDNIGCHFRTTVKALAREGVITTSGWKHAMTFPVIRSSECMHRHIHVHTHYARYSEGLAAVEYALHNDWLPPTDGPIYAWEDIPRLADDYRHGRLDTLFPIFAINPLA